MTTETDDLPPMNLTVALEAPAIGAPLMRPKLERFAQRLAATGNASRAYRESYAAADMKPPTVARRAYELAHDPAVERRVRELLAAAAGDTATDIAARIVRLRSIVEADSADVVKAVTEPCRRCWGALGLYQWRDATEFAEACAVALDEAAEHGRPLRLPSDAGGYGYTVHKDANPHCEHCGGRGHVRLQLTPSDQLPAGARALVRSIKQKPSGEIEVTFVDRLAASDQLNKIQGAYAPERHLNINANIDPNDLPTDATPERIADAYLSMIGATP